MGKTGCRLLMLMLVVGLLFTIPACQKKQITSQPSAASGSGGGMGGAAGGKGIGEQDLGGAAGRAGAGGAIGAIGASERSTFENEDIHFRYDSSALTTEAQDLLRKKAAFLKANPNVKVTIEGHCDERGTNEYNLALGEARAKAAKAFMADLGIPAARMATISYGEERPLVQGHTEEAYAKNRRAHFVIEQ